MPALSIVTISFNQGNYIDDCIASVVSQRTPNVEYVVVDAGSTDDSRARIAAYGDCIDRVILEPDDGPADGLNKGFAAASGDVFAYVNADDRLAPGAVEFVLEFFRRRPDVDVLCGAIRIIDQDGRPSSRKRTSDRFDLRRYAAGVCTVGQQATFFRRASFLKAGGFNVANRISWDGELLVDLALSGARFETARKVLGDFRIYRDSITGSGRFRAKLEAERLRIGRKIAGHGIRLYAPIEERVARVLYKANLKRHLDYLTVR